MGNSTSRTSSRITVVGTGNTVNAGTTSQSHAHGIVNALLSLPFGINPVDIVLDADSLSALMIDEELSESHDGFLDLIGKLTSSGTRINGYIQGTARFLEYVTKASQFIQGITGKGKTFLGQDFAKISSALELLSNELNSFVNDHKPDYKSHGPHHSEDSHDGENDLISAYNKDISESIHVLQSASVFDKIASHQVTVDAGKTLRVLKAATAALLIVARHATRAQGDVHSCVIQFANYGMMPSQGYVKRVAKGMDSDLTDRAYDYMSMFGHTVGVRAIKSGILDDNKTISPPTFLSDFVNNVSLSGTSFQRIGQNAARISDNKQLYPVDAMAQAFDGWTTNLYPWMPQESLDMDASSLTGSYLSRSCYASGVSHSGSTISGLLNSLTPQVGNQTILMAHSSAYKLSVGKWTSRKGISAWLSITFVVKVTHSADRVMDGFKVGLAGYRNEERVVRTYSKSISSQTTTTSYLQRGVVDIDLMGVDRGGLSKFSQFGDSTGDVLLVCTDGAAADITSISMSILSSSVHFRTYGAAIPIMVPEDTISFYDTIGTISDASRSNNCEFHVCNVWNRYIAGVMRYFDLDMLLADTFHESHPNFTTVMVQYCEDQGIQRRIVESGVASMEQVTNLNCGLFLSELLHGVERWLLNSSYNPLYHTTSIRRAERLWDPTRYLACMIVSMVSQLSMESVYSSSHIDAREFWKSKMTRYQRA
jgi:hypothetical protein